MRNREVSGSRFGKRRRKTRPRPSPSRQWSVRYALGAYLATLILDFALALGLSHSELKLGLGVLVIDLAMLATPYPLYRIRAFGPRDLGLVATSAPAGVGLVVGALVLYGLVSAGWTRGVLGHAANPFVPQIHESAAAKVLTGFAVAICGPVVEEIFFRGLLYRALRNRLNVAGAALIAGVLFGMVHASTYPLDSLPPKAAFGIIACLLYERTGSLYPGIALHCLVDASAFAAATSHGNVAIAYIVFAGLAVFLLVGRQIKGPSRLAVDAYRWRPGRSP